MSGGANTNINGLPFEKRTQLDTNPRLDPRIHTRNTRFGKLRARILRSPFNHVQFPSINNSNHDFYDVSKRALHKYMKTDLSRVANGCKVVDEAYIDEMQHIVYIIEKKYQTQSGSVCEKIQSGVFKQEQFRKLFPDYTVYYIYCLSEWFRDHCPIEIEYLRKNNVAVFFGDKNTYKNDILKFMSQ